MSDDADTENTASPEFTAAADRVRDRVRDLLSDMLDETRDAVGFDAGQTMMALVCGAMAASCDVVISFDVDAGHDEAVADWIAEIVRQNLPELRREMRALRAECRGSA